MRDKLLLFMLLIPGWLTAQETLTLEALRQMALEHNKSLAVARHSVDAANQLKKAAFTQFLPNFSALGDYSYNQKNLKMLGEDALLPVGTKMADGSFGFTPEQISNQWTMIEGRPVPLDASGKPFDPAKNPQNILWKNYAVLPKEAMEFDVRNIFVGGINFIQPVYLGGKIAEMYRLAGYSEQLAQARKENQEQELLVEVDEAYWRVISLESKLALAREYRSLVARLDSNINLMVEEGVATQADALKVQVKLNEADMTVTRAENGLSLSRMALNQLCGLPISDQPQLADQQLSTPEPVVEMVPLEMAWNNRPEIKALMQAENMARSNERIMLSRFLPNVAFTGNYLYSNPNLFNGFEKKFDGMFSFGVVATVPVFHFGERLHTLRAARSTREMSTLQVEEAKEKIELQINQQSYKITESLKKQVAALKNTEHAQENLHAATEGFEAGVITSTDLMMAQTAWLSAQSEYIDATIEVKLCNLYLKKSLGILEVPPVSQKK